MVIPWGVSGSSRTPTAARSGSMPW